MPDWDKLTGYRLPGAGGRLSEKLRKDRAKANVPEPTGPSITKLDQYVTDTAGGKLARRRNDLESQMLGVPHEYRKGGVVKKTGMAKVHKGERVLTKKQAKKASMRKKM